jgi:CRISPR-associated protein (TIGR03986 family)
MQNVDDKRYGLRDISGRYVKNAYAGKVIGKMKTGFMKINADGKAEITPCQMTRVSHRDLEDYRPQMPKPIFSKRRKSVKDKYQAWGNDISIKFDLGKTDSCTGQVKDMPDAAINLGRGKSTGTLVFTGQISDSSDNKTNQAGKTTCGKYLDFIFYNEVPSKKFLVNDRDWQDFLFVHHNDGGPGSEGMSWPGYWKGQFYNKMPVPVFYVESEDKQHVRIGLAYMPRLAGDFSVHDCIKHTNEAHLEDAGDDFCQTLFGRVGEKPEQALKGRVSFETALVHGQPTLTKSDPTILNGPKPSYFPNYIKQKTAANTAHKLQGDTYATYVKSQGNEKPEIRGYKRYPVRPAAMAQVQPLNQDQRANKKVQVELHTLPINQKFTSRVVFHNLKAEELGGLLYALTWGGDDKLRHSIGMGKSFGFGQLSCEVAMKELIANDPEQTAIPDAAYFMESFKKYMDQQVKGWEQSLPIQTLKAMANPSLAGNNPAFHGKLKHMDLGMGASNQFVQAKQAALVLEPYSNQDTLPSGTTTKPSAGQSNRKDDQTPRTTEPPPIKAEHPKLQGMIEEVVQNIKENDVKKILRGNPLAKKWQALPEGEEKEAVRKEIIALRKKHGLWDDVTGAAKESKAIYES